MDHEGVHLTGSPAYVPEPHSVGTDDLRALLTVFLPDAAGMERFGEAIGSALIEPTLILMYGELGAGKTTLVRGIGRGLDLSTVIQSPTFSLIQEHEGRLTLHHVDLYRLAAESDLDALGLEECVDGDGITIIEWPELALSRLPPERLEIRIEPDHPGRQVTLSVQGASLALHQWVARLAAAWTEPGSRR